MFFIDHKKKRTTWKDPRFKDVNEPDNSELSKINNKTDPNCCRNRFRKIFDLKYLTQLIKRLTRGVIASPIIPLKPTNDIDLLFIEKFALLPRNLPFSGSFAAILVKIFENYKVNS